MIMIMMEIMMIYDDVAGGHDDGHYDDFEDHVGDNDDDRNSIQNSYEIIL